MLNIAINMEKNVQLQPIYVTYSDVTDGKLTKSQVLTQGQTQSVENPDGTYEDSGFSAEQQLARATLSDLFFASSSKGNGAYMDVVDSLTKGDGDINGIFGICTRVSVMDVQGTSVDMVYQKNATIPTFVLTNSQNSGYKAIVLDYCDQYDIQQFATAAVKAAQTGDSYGDTMFKHMGDNFDNLTGDSLKQELDKYVLQLDCFGNIVTEVDGKRYIVYPACLNQHLTKESQINLINQLVMNGVSAQQDQNNYVLYGGFKKNGALFQNNYSGISPLNNGNSSVPSGQIAIYFDTDQMAGIKLQNGSDMGVHSNNQVYTTVNWGENLKAVFSAKLGAQNNQIPFKIQVVNPDDTAGIQGQKSQGKDLLYKNAILAQQIFSNQATPNKQSVNTELQMLYSQKSQQSIFGDQVAVSVMTAPQGQSAQTQTVARQFVNFVYQNYSQGSNSQVRQEIDTILSSSSQRDDIRNKITASPNGLLVEFWKAKGGSSGYWSQPITQASGATTSASSLVDRLLPTNWWVGSEAVQSKLNLSGSSSDADITKFTQTDDEMFGRTIVVYSAQNVLQSVQAVLNLKSGADFETYATDVYYTYLKFYGILNDYGVQTGGSKFNPDIFSDDLVSDLSKINELLGDGSYMTQEQKLQSILDGTYTLIQRQLDRDYNITDFIYNQYYKIVFGRSQQTTVTNTIQTKSANGFLQIHTYAENFLTAFFIDGYAKYCSAILIGLVFVIIILGVLKSKGAAWCFSNLFLAVNIVLLMPQVGEITPYICNLVIENAFQNSLQFWSISETLNNYNADQGIQELSGLSDDELNAAVKIYKNHQALNLDHTLMLKLDISKKIMSTDQTDYTALQQLQTARWLLPMIMQEWQAQDGNYDYVQVTLGSEIDNLSNIYWKYKPSDASKHSTVAASKVNSSQFKTDWDTSLISTTKVQALTSKFTGYQEIQNFDKTINDSLVQTRSILYTKNPNIKDRPSNYFYILDETYPLSVTRPITPKGKTDWDNWYKQTLSSTTGDFNIAYNNIVKTAQSYDQTDPNTVQQSYGYLWTTQNPFSYFYFVVKESMNEDYNLNDVYNVLQGDFVLNRKTGKDDLRRSDLMFMTLAVQDGKASVATPSNQPQDGCDYSAQRDVLDLNHLFTNVVPYLYEMTLATGGTGDGTQGFFSDSDTIGSEYQVYEGNLKSWLFRSNWAIKIVENSNYNKEQTIQDAQGNKYKITQTWDPKAYPEQRPMVVSRAQQLLQGLDDSDLTTFELKCIELNEKVCNEWTRLINYINLEGMTPEVIYREMQLIAMLEFNKTFQPQTFTGSSLVMYPYTLDIRYISFDSIMRMLMLNVSKDTQYIYNDTMQTVINNSDMFTQVVLLIQAILCSGIVPFFRDVLMAMIFYLGFLQLAKQIFQQTKAKLSISQGILVCNLIVQGMTLAYYWTFQAMMGVTTYDSVLDLGNAQITTGTPFWCFLFVMIVSAIYIQLMYLTAKFVWVNRGDMGFEAFSEMARSMTESVNVFADKISQGLFSGGQSEQTNSNPKAKDISGQKDGVRENSKIGHTEKFSVVSDTRQSKSESDDTEMREYEQANYTTGDTKEDSKDFDDSRQIDAEIKKGKDVE